MATPTGKPPKITPTLVPPEAPIVAESDNSRKVIIVLVVLLFLLISVLIYGVLVLLPGHTPEIPALSSVKSPVVTSPKKPVENRSPAVGQPLQEIDFNQKQQANAVLKNVLGRQSMLEGKNIETWGGAAYQEILSFIAEGDVFLHEEQFLEAVKKYEAADGRLQALSDKKQIILQQALEVGELQLHKEDSVKAMDAYRIVLAIDPENSIGLQNIERAKNLEHVINLCTEAETYEREGDVQSALQRYRQCYQLDKLYKPAEDGLQRVEEKLQQQTVEEYLAVFYSAMQQGKLEQAEIALSTAISASPYNQAVVGAQKEYTQAREAEIVDNLRRLADKFSNDEDWQNALDTYQKILRTAPNAGFAISGSEKARKNLTLSRRLDDFIKNLQRLQDDTVLQNAEATLQYAAALGSFGPSMTAKINALDQAVRHAKIIVTLTLYSDNMTEVAIFHVGRLGRFQQKQLQMKPGQYIITGERPGFRAVRHELVLSHKNPAVDFTIVCKEQF